MLGGKCDLRQAVLYPVLILQVCSRNRRHAHNDVHGRPYLMGHSGEKILFGVTGLLGKIERILQLMFPGGQRLDIAPLLPVREDCQPDG